MQILQLTYSSSIPLVLQTANNHLLQPTGTIEIPVTWQNGHCTRFQMLIIPNLSQAIIFGHNHLLIMEL